LALDDALYYLASGDPVKIYKNVNPDKDTWELIDTKFRFPMVGNTDPDFFRDDDGRVFIYWGCSNKDPIIGVEVDPQNGFKTIGEPAVLIEHRSNQYGWEAPGNNNEENKDGWNEGANMLKYNGKYYLQYAAPGTEFRTYGDGVYVSDKPLGPFRYAEQNPFSFKPGGFIGGAGHGCTFMDKYGNYWHVSTMKISVRHMFERRLGLFPLRIDDGGNFIQQSVWSDYPFIIPNKKMDYKKENLSAGWNLLSYHQPVAASSFLPEYAPEYAVDEKVETWWSAKTGQPGEWFQVDLQKKTEVEAIQVNFADQDFNIKAPHNLIFYRYIIEASGDGIKWVKIIDKSKNTKDAVHELVVLNKPVETRYLRITNCEELPGKFSLYDFRVFGKGKGELPQQVTDLKVARNPQDPRKFHLSWASQKDATGYIVNVSLANGTPVASVMVFNNEYQGGFFNRNSDYTFTINAFNANGVAAYSKEYEKTPNGIKTAVQSQNVEIQFYNDKIVRILKQPEGVKDVKKSFSVIKSPETVKLSVEQKNEVISVKSQSLKVDVNRQTGKIVIFDSKGRELVADKSSDFTPVKDGTNDSYTVLQTFSLDKDEAIYGLGQQQNGKLNQRGEKIMLRQENMKICIPFIQSSKAYGLFWDNYSPTLFEDGDNGMSFKSTGLCVDYYIMCGKNSDGVITQMRDLTGQAPMFPLWAYGYWQSRERYTGQQELLDVVKKYRELGVPLDGIVQDWQYWSTDNAYWNAINWGNPQFPDPQKMIDEVHRLNAHIIISIWPSFGRKTGLYQTFKEKDMLFGIQSFPVDDSVRVYDAFDPEARNIYWNAINKNLFSLGMDGWWLDATEPEHANIKESDFDQKTYSGNLRDVCNAFPLATVGGVYDHQRATTSNKRTFILTRSAFAGQQRCGAVCWSGDVDGNWQSLKKQIPAALNFSLCGIPYWNSDIGGFFIRERDFKNPLQNDGYKELYVRWLQFAVFTPMMRSHGTNAPREIWRFGEKGGKFYDAIEEYIDLRYQLLPYLYSTAWEISKYAGSFMRPLFADFSNDEKTYAMDNEYLFGKSFLVAPVTDANQETKTVYLPKGIKWYRFGAISLPPVEGGQEIECRTPLDTIPLYVKEGTILPLAHKVQYAAEKKWDNLDVFIYPGADGEFTLYEDENDNYNYENGKYSTIKMTWNNAKKTFTICKCKGGFDGMLKRRKFNIYIAGSNQSKEIVYDGNEQKIILLK